MKAFEIGKTYPCVVGKLVHTTATVTRRTKQTITIAGEGLPKWADGERFVIYACDFDGREKTKSSSMLRMLA